MFFLGGGSANDPPLTETHSKPTSNTDTDANTDEEDDFEHVDYDEYAGAEGGGPEGEEGAEDPHCGEEGEETEGDATYNPFDTVRTIAELNGYKQLHYNEQSAKIAFAKEFEYADGDEDIDDKNKPERVRLNVYFASRTVAGYVHLHEEAGGQIQFWKSKPNIQELQAIFQNPLVLLDDDMYYALTAWRSGGPSEWTAVTIGDEDEIIYKSPEEEDEDDDDDDEYVSSPTSMIECDDARRWKYVQAATGFCTPQDADRIGSFCENWANLRYTTGEERLDRAGSFPALGKLLCEVALETDPDVLVPMLTFPMGSRDAVDAKSIPMDEFINSNPTTEQNEFVELHGAKLKRLKRELRSFEVETRRELIQWFFQELLNGCTLIVKVGAKPGDDEENTFSTYKNHFLVKAVRAAHIDYGEMYYGPK